MIINIYMTKNNEFVASTESEVVKCTKWRDTFLAWLLKNSFEEMHWAEDTKIASLHKSYDNYLLSGKDPTGAKKSDKPKAERKPKEEKKAVEVKPVEQEAEVDSAEVKVTSEGSELKEVKAVVNGQAVHTERTYTSEDGDVITIIA